jgi:hypothetical protein
VDPSRPDTIARRPQFRTHNGHCHSVRRLRQHAVRRTPWSGQPPASRFRYRRGHRRRRASTAVAGGACMDGRLPATAMSLLCSGEPRPQRRAAVRPAPGRTPGRPADTAAVSGSADTPGFRARSAQPADTGGPNVRPRTRPADTRNPQSAGTVDTRDRGMGTRTLRQRPAGQPATEPSTTAYMSGRGTGPQGAASASTAMARPPDP